MSIVIAGATGQLGRLVVESLLGRGLYPSSIVAAGRRIGALDDLAERGVMVRAIDYADPPSLAAAFAGADRLLLVSGSEVGRRVAQHTAAIDAAAAVGVRHIVYTSAPHADVSPLILAPEHKATEEVIRASGIPFTILRNSWYTENYAGLIEEARATGEIVASVGDGRVASASRRDYADAAAVVLTGDGHEGIAYELSGDVAWTFDELADAVGAAIGREVVYRPLSPDDHRARLAGVGLDEGTAAFVVALDGDIRAGLIAETSGDLARLIGRPTTPMPDEIAALAARGAQAG